MWSALIGILAAAGLYHAWGAGPSGGSLAADLDDLDGSPQAIRELAADAGLPDDWADFLVAKAWVESRWNPYSARGLQPGAPEWLPKINEAAGDAAAARQAWERQRFERGVFESTPWPEERYTFGTFGLWQLMPANAIASSFKGTRFENLDPWSHFVPARQMAMAVDYNHGLMKRQAFKDDPTWATLYAGWSLPSNMSALDSPEVAAALERFADGLHAAGIPLSFMERKPSKAPGAIEIIERIGNV